MSKTIVYNGKVVYAASPKVGTVQLEEERQLARLEGMRDAYRRGETLEVIGKRYGFSKQRVHQALKKHFGIIRDEDQPGYYLEKYSCTRAEFYTIPVKIRVLYRSYLSNVKDRSNKLTLLEFAAQQEIKNAKARVQKLD